MYLKLIMYLFSIVLSACASGDVDVKIYASNVAKHGEDHVIILTLESIQSGWFQCKILSTNYLIDIVETNLADENMYFAWQKTIDLLTTLNFYDIYPEMPLQYYEGWVYVTKAKFWTFGLNTVVVEVTKKASKRSTPVDDVSVHVEYHNDFGACVPKLDILYCADFEKGGKKFEFSKAMILQGGVIEPCGDYDITTPYKWMVYDSLGKELYENVGYSWRPIWNFKAYHFPVTYVKNNVGMFLVQLSANIRGMNIIARCYLKPKKGNIEAKLLGERQRVVSAGSTFILDARNSYDSWCPPGDIQYLRFKWRCHPMIEDKNELCSSVRNLTNSHLRLSTLDLPRAYKFTVYVTSLVDSKRRSSTHQYIKVVANQSKESFIACVENCEQNEFNAAWRIVLQVHCLDCDEHEKITYKWSEGRKLNVIGSAEKLVYTPNENDNDLAFNVLLTITDTKKHEDKQETSTASIKMIKNNGPTVGLCSVNPTSGIESKTKFRIDCSNFASKHKPLSYCILSDEIPVGSCSNRPQFKIRFPRTKVAALLVCDSRNACVTKTLHIQITNYDTVRNDTDNKALYIGNLRNSFQHGDSLTAFRRCLYLSKTLTEQVEIAKLVYAMEAFLPRTLIQFMELVHLARNLMENLQPLNDFRAMLLTKIVRIISESFAEVMEGQLTTNTNEKIFLNIAHTILYLVNSFMENAEQIPRAHCNRFQADCLGYDDLTDNYEELESFDPYILVHIDHFLHLHWELQKCVSFLGKFSFKIVKTSDKKSIKYSLSQFDLEQFYYKINDQEIHITTSDNQHSLIFNRRLLKELQIYLDSKEIMIQIFHETENSMYWWYPQVNAPSTKLVWVNVFSAKKMINSTQLDEPMEVISVLKDLNRQHANEDIRNRRHKRKPRQVVRTTPKPVDLSYVDEDYETDYDFIGGSVDEEEDESLSDYVINGYLDAPYQMQVFRTDLFSDAVLALKFLSATVDLLVTMTVNEPASTFAVKGSSCPLHAYRAYNTTFLMMNLCNKTMQAYIVVRSTLKDDDWEGMHGEAIEFSFELESRTCNDWSYDRPQPNWRTVACYPHLNATLEKGIHCQCEFISQFNTKIIPMNAIAMPGTGTGGARGRANRIFVMFFYFIVNIALVVTLYVLKSRVKVHETLLPAVPYDHAKEDNGRGHIMVELQIGGRDQAGSTANLHISFSSEAGQHNFIVYRDDKNDHFKKNETITLRLQSRYVKLPTMLALGHDHIGVTPNYYVRNIVIRDLDNQITQEFRVEQWIDGDQEFYMTSICITGGLEAHTELYNWRWQFKKVMEFHFNNWFLFQPVLGPWRSGMSIEALNRYERCCVWTCKFAITLCIVSCVFGRSTTHACETTQKAYYEPAFIIPLALTSFLVSCVVHSIMVKLIKSSHKYGVEIW